MYGDYKELFEKLGDDASVVAGEAGKDTIAGYQKGLNDNDVDLEKEATDGPFSKFVNAVKKFLGIHSPSTVFAEIGGFTMSGFLNGLNSNSGKVLEWFSKLPGNIKDKLGDAKEWIKDKGKNALEGLKNGWDSVKESKVGQTVQKIGGYVKDKAGNAGQWIKSKGSDAINGLRAGWDSVKQSGFLNTVGQIGGQVYKGIGNLRDKVKGKGTDIINGLKNGFDSNSWRFYNSFSGIGSKITSSIGNLYSLGRGVMRNFANGLSSVGIKLPHISYGTSGNEVILMVGNSIIPCPSALEYGLQDVSASESGRTEDTRMQKNRVGQKRTLSLQWVAKNWQETSSLMLKFDPEYIFVYYPDMKSGDYEVREFYSGDKKTPVKWWWVGNKKMETVSFDVIER